MNAGDIYRDARELSKLSDSVIVQIPFVEDAIEAIRRLSADGVRVAATLVFNAAQAMLAAKAGAGTVCVHVRSDRLAGARMASTRSRDQSRCSACTA